MPNLTNPRAIKLINFAKNDVQFNAILEHLTPLDINIDFKWFDRCGSYQPQALNLKQIEELEDKVKQLRDNKLVSATITLSPRFGTWVMYHTFLHELFHIYQDTLGLFMTPLHIQGKPQFSLDEASFKTVRLFNESFAATEAIRASYRLKEMGHPQAWYGALLSPDWHKLARTYAKDIKNSNEDTAASNLFNNWHETHLKKYYENIEPTKATSPMKLNGITYESLSALIPEKERPPYLKACPKNTLEHIKKGSPLSYLLHQN